MTMIERVAAAIDQCPEWPANTYRERVARAALEAILGAFNATMAEAMQPHLARMIMEDTDPSYVLGLAFDAAIQAALDEEQR